MRSPVQALCPVIALLVVGAVSLTASSALAQLSGFWTSTRNTGCSVSHLLFQGGNVVAWDAFMKPDPKEPDFVGTWKLTGNRIEIRLEDILGDRMSITGTLANNRMNVRVVDGANTTSCLFLPG